MKSLKESILSSTNTGKLGKIQEWCEKNIKFATYEVQHDGKIINKNNKAIIINYNKSFDIPSYIKFGKLSGTFLIGNLINVIKQEQLPEICNYFYVGNVETIENELHIKVRRGFAVEENHLSKIKKNITIEYTNDECFLDFSYSKINLKDLNKINVIGKNVELDLTKTPAEMEIYKNYYNEDNSFDEIIKKNFPKLANNINSIKFDFAHIEKNDKNEWI